MNQIEPRYMRRALDLAQLGMGRVSPNPMVGCVVVKDDQIIGEGYHQIYGQAHAEVNAIAAVANPEWLPESTLYVSLEPCSHFGKTPPCADLVVRSGIRQVVVANLDPNPLVAGRGIAKLREAGIEVTTGILGTEAARLNQRFFTYMVKKRPYIILKWAETADGFVARENYDSKWISHAHSRQMVHQWRAQEDAVLVGTKTAQYDDPQLNVRDWAGRDPLRIVIDRQLKLANYLKLFDASQPTICYNLLKDEELPNLNFIKLQDSSFLENLFQDLYRRKVGSVMVEGGSQLLQALIKSDLWDEVRIFKSPTVFGKGIRAPHHPGILQGIEKIASDWLFSYQHPEHITVISLEGLS